MTYIRLLSEQSRAFLVIALALAVAGAVAALRLVRPKPLGKQQMYRAS